MYPPQSMYPFLPLLIWAREASWSLRAASCSGEGKGNEFDPEAEAE